MKYNVHGNGFLQISLANGKRLHVFDDSIPRQVVPTLMHDHRFDFISMVMRGTLINVRIAITPHDDRAQYLVFTPNTNKIPNVDGKLIPSDAMPYSPVVTGVDRLYQGSVYTMRAGEFHQSVPVGHVVTVMEILSKYDREPRVLVHRDVEPDNAFDRCNAMSENDVWVAINQFGLEEIIAANGGSLS